jgi:hypothetical protein
MMLLHLGSWTAGTTDGAWWFYIFVFMAVALLVTLQPKLKLLGLLAAAPLAVSVLGKAIYFTWLGYYIVFASDILTFTIGSYATYSALALLAHTWGVSLKQLAFVSLWLLVGLSPISYRFASETAHTSNPSVQGTLRDEAAHRP